LVVLVLLLLPLVFYLSNSKEPRDHNLVDRAIVWISSPVQWLVVAALEGVSTGWSRYVALIDVARDNEQLRAENARLASEVAAREEMRLENERLQRLLSLRDRSPIEKAVFARVIAVSPTPLFRSVRIDRGEQDGVHLGAAVVSHAGVVGRVGALGGDWSDVMLLVDANNSTDVLVQRTRARARVRGKGGDRELGIKIEFLGRTEDVAPGDVLITSGAGKVFPKGLVVGRVLSIERAAFGLYQEAAVQPSVDFTRLEELMVLRAGWPGDTTYEETPPEEAPKVSDLPPVEGGTAAAPKP
jgi:rod shape-determining protein MreC